MKSKSSKLAQIVQKYLQTAYFGQEYYQTLEIEGLVTEFVSASNLPKGLRYHVEFERLAETTYITVYGKIEQEPTQQHAFVFEFLDVTVNVSIKIESSQIEYNDYSSSISLSNNFQQTWEKFKGSMLDLEGSNLFTKTNTNEMKQVFYANNYVNIGFNDLLRFDITKPVRLKKSNKSSLSYVALSNPRSGLPTLMIWSYPDSEENQFGVAKFKDDGEELIVYNLFFKSNVGWLSDSYVSDVQVINGNWHENVQNVESGVFDIDSFKPYHSLEVFKNIDKNEYEIKLPLSPEPNSALYEDYNNLVSVFDKPKLLINGDLNYIEYDKNIDSSIYDVLKFTRPLELLIDGFETKFVQDAAGNIKYGLIGLKIKDMNDSRDYNLALHEYMIGRDEPTPSGEIITSNIPMVLTYKHLDGTLHNIATLNGIKYLLDQEYGKIRDINPEWMGQYWTPFIPLFAVKTDYINRLFGILINNYMTKEYFYNKKIVVSKVAFDPYFDNITSTLKKFNVDIANNLEWITETND